MNPRLLVEDDVQWMIDLARVRFRAFDPVAARSWFVNDVLTNDRYFAMRTEDAFLVAVLGSMSWASRTEAIVLILITADDKPWQIVRLLRESIKWARQRKAAHWHFWMDDADAGALARRVGARENTKRYRVDL
jgi:TfoX/Sxy family transcriptional regulator of competence genes